MVIFAQGGLAAAGPPRPFKVGAFFLAIATGTPVVPVAIQGTAQALPPGARLAIRPGVLTVELLPPVPTADLDPHDRRELHRRTEQAVLGRLRVPGTPAALP